jgi:hypothetical protein
LRHKVLDRAMARRAAGSGAGRPHDGAEAFGGPLHQRAANLGFGDSQAMASNAIRGNVDGGHAIMNPVQEASAGV